MREELADMRLDLQTVKLDRRFCEGLAFAYLKSAGASNIEEDRHKHMAVAATNFRRAGAQSILLDDFDSAKRMFSEAGRIYAQLGLPYALMMSALGQNFELAQETFYSMLRRHTNRAEEGLSLPRRQQAYMLLFRGVSHGPVLPELEFNVDGVLEDMRRELQACSSAPIGILGLPVASYLDLALALSGDHPISPQEALLPFLSAYNTAIRQNSHNGYHWSKMVFPFHPAEPDIISVLVVTDLALKKTQRSVNDLLKEFPLAWLSRTILQGALAGLNPPESSEFFSHSV
jgi:hypothetical protein